MQTKLYQATLDLVHNRPRRITYEVIAQNTGLQMEWIRNFALKKTLDPGVSKVETLYIYLSGKELEL